MFVIFVLLALQILDDLRGPSIAHLFTPLEYRPAGGRFRDQSFKYRLFVPERMAAGKRLPLLIWLHGEGESGSDNVEHLRWLPLVFKDKTDRSKYPFFALAVQKPAGEPWARSVVKAAGAADDMLGIVMSIVDRLMEDYEIDPDRVYLSGVSSGGTASWELGARHPQRFAAIAPLASAGIDLSEANQFVRLPVLAFHSKYDMGTPPESVRQTVDAINAAGGDAELVEIETNRHDCWTAAFREHDLLQWMLLQKRGSPPRELRTQAIPDAYRDFIAGYGWIVLVAILLVIVLWVEKRRQRKPCREVRPG